MKLIFAVVLTSLLFAACSVSIRSGSSSCSSDYPVPAVASTTIDEINVIAGLSFDSEKEKLLCNVADRPTPTPAEQSHLVHTAMHRLSFDSGRQNVLKHLIRNPAFSQEAKDAIFADISRLSFDSAKSAIISDLQQHPVQSPRPAVEATPQSTPLAG